MKGAAELHRALAHIPDAVRREVHDELDRRAAAVVADMRALAPVDKGDLRDSINYAFVHPARVRIFAGAGAAHVARFVEYGTQNAPAQAFFWPVYRANKRALKAALSRAVTRAFKNKKS